MKPIYISIQSAAGAVQGLKNTHNEDTVRLIQFHSKDGQVETTYWAAFSFDYLEHDLHSLAAVAIERCELTGPISLVGSVDDLTVAI